MYTRSAISSLWHPLRHSLSQKDIGEGVQAALASKLVSWYVNILLIIKMC